MEGETYSFRHVLRKVVQSGDYIAHADVELRSLAYYICLVMMESWRSPPVNYVPSGLNTSGSASPRIISIHNFRSYVLSRHSFVPLTSMCRVI